jgi:hypothetical protein
MVSPQKLSVKILSTYLFICDDIISLIILQKNTDASSIAGVLVFIKLGHDIFSDGPFVSPSIGIILTTSLSSSIGIISFGIHQSMDSCEKNGFQCAKV